MAEVRDVVRGPRLGPDTTTPGWNGEPFDLGWAIHVFKNR
jgi:hypothetical protein